MVLIHSAEIVASTFVSFFPFFSTAGNAAKREENGCKRNPSEISLLGQKNGLAGGQGAGNVHCRLPDFHATVGLPWRFAQQVAIVGYINK